MMFDGNVLVVGAGSSPIATAIPPAAPADAPKRFATVDSVSFEGYESVYNLEVEDAHHFSVEGGIVVHNCWDAARYALDARIKRARLTGFLWGTEVVPTICPACQSVLPVLEDEGEPVACTQCGWTAHDVSDHLPDDGADEAHIFPRNGNGHRAPGGLGGING